LSHLILAKDIDEEVASEALRWLGRMEDTKSYSKRLWLLERGLASPSPIIRDGAALGLASLDDRHAIPYLRLAVEREELDELRFNLGQVLDQLEDAR
jgi:hypothetical protein